MQLPPLSDLTDLTAIPPPLDPAALVANPRPPRRCPPIPPRRPRRRCHRHDHHDAATGHDHDHAPAHDHDHDPLTRHGRVVLRSTVRGSRRVAGRPGAPPLRARRLRGHRDAVLPVLPARRAVRGSLPAPHRRRRRRNAARATGRHRTGVLVRRLPRRLEPGSHRPRRDAPRSRDPPLRRERRDRPSLAASRRRCTATAPSRLHLGRERRRRSHDRDPRARARPLPGRGRVHPPARRAAGAVRGGGQRGARPRRLARAGHRRHRARRERRPVRRARHRSARRARRRVYRLGFPAAPKTRSTRCRSRSTAWCPASSTSIPATSTTSGPSPVTAGTTESLRDARIQSTHTVQRVLTAAEVVASPAVDDMDPYQYLAVAGIARTRPDMPIGVVVEACPPVTPSVHGSP